MSSVPRKSVFELIAGNPVLDFVNTLDWRFRESGPEELIESYADLVSFAEQSGLLAAKQSGLLMRKTSSKRSEKVLLEARQARETLAAMLYGIEDGRKSSGTELKKLEDWMKSTQKELRLTIDQGKFVWKLPTDDTTPELPLWLLALSAQELMSSDRMELVRACAKKDCRWLFLDTSKNHSRRWCDMKICGNRMKAKRFKAQHAAKV